MTSRVFSGLIDQERVITSLESAISAARTGSTGQEMTHAWLFTGPPGSGRSNAAKAFAAALICKNDGCGECTECMTVLNGTHPDVEILDVSGVSIKIDEIREAVSRSAWGASTSPWRIVVIEDCDRMTEAAANALLKALEEPASQTIWLLCAPTLQDVLPTIRSRCRHLNLKTPSATEIAKFLQKSFNIEKSDAELAARISHGHIGRAKGFLKDDTFKKSRRQYFELLFTIKNESSAIKAAGRFLEIATEKSNSLLSERSEREIDELKSALQGTGRSLVSGGAKAVKDLEKDQKSRLNRAIRDELDGALLDYSTFFRDALLDLEQRINSDLSEEIDKIAEKFKREEIAQLLSVISQVRELLTTNAAQLLLIERVFLTFASLNRGN